MADAPLTEIRAALETRLGTLSPTWPTAYQGVAFDKPTDGQYQKLTIVPAQSEGYPGNDAFTKYQGLFNIIIVIPSNNGMGDAEGRAKAILGHFSRGLSIQSGSVYVRIGQAYVAPATIEDEEISLPVWVPYFCHV